MNDEDTPLPRKTAAYGVPTPHLEPSTPFRATIAAIVSGAAALIAASAIAATTYTRLNYRMDRMDDRQSNAATKQDLVNMKGEVIQATRAGVRRALIKCPKVALKGESVVLCEVVMSGDN